MKRSNMRWAPLFFLCLALVMAPGANAANTANNVRKFTLLAPRDPQIQASIDAQNADLAKLRKGEKASATADGSAKFSGSRQQRAQPNRRSPMVFPGRTTGGVRTKNERQTRRTNLSGVHTSPFPSVSAAVSTTPTPMFGGFLNAQLFSSGGNEDVAHAIAIDVDNDGHPDLLNLRPLGSINVLLNDGKDGGFDRIVTNEGGSKYTQSGYNATVYITPGDLNGDNLVDLVVTQYGGRETTQGSVPALLVYANQGNGKFSDPTIVQLTLGPNEHPGSVIVTDRDGDGKPDITVVSYQEIIESRSSDGLNTPTSYHTNINVRTLYGNGDGTFQGSANISHYTYAGYSVTVPNGSAQFVTLGGTKYLAFEASAYGWEFNWNSYHNELMTRGVSVLFFQDGNGNRSSQPVADVPSKEVEVASDLVGSMGNFGPDWYNTNGLSLTDVNGDGLPDITLSYVDYLYGALGTADGGFASPRVIAHRVFQYFPDWWSRAHALVDVNGDGNPDIIAKNYYDVTVWLGNGDGTFANPKEYYTTEFVDGANLVVADRDGDGNLDYVTAVWSGTAMGLFKGFGDGTFVAPRSTAAPNGSPTSDTAATNFVLDLNGDGLSDIVVTNYLLGTLSSAISDGKGHLTWTSRALTPASGGLDAIGHAASHVVGDFNNDGLEDLLLAGEVFTEGGYDQGVALSKGDRTFADVILLKRPLGELPQTTLVGDINNDGNRDFVNTYCGYSGTVAPSIAVALGNGDGSFQNVSYIDFGQCPTRAVLADVNGDGNLDLVVFDDYTGELTTLLGNGTGTFDTTAPILVSTDYAPQQIRTLDVNNDGHIDLAVLNSWPNNVAILTGAGDGTFALANTLDFENGQAGPDIAVADFNGDGCADLIDTYLTLGNCDGTFQEPQLYFSPWAQYDKIHIGTFTPDRQPSAVGITGVGVPGMILYNQAGTKVSLATSLKAITAGESVSFTADMEPTWTHRPVPTGTVSFYDNGNLLGTTSVIAGTAAFSTSSLAVGSHAITATYSGNANFNRQSSSAVNVTVAQPAPVDTQAEIAINSPIASMVLKMGDSKTATLAVIGSSNYTGTVTFSVSGATGGLGVSVSPTTVSLANGNSATVSINVTTVAGTTTATAGPMQR